MASATAKNSIYGFPGSVEIGDAASGQTRVRRLGMTKDTLTTQPLDGIATVPDVLDYAARTHGTKNSFGWRDIIDVHEEKKDVKKNVGGHEITETKTWKYFQLSDYKYISFVQVKEAAMEVAGGLLKLGVQKTDIYNIYVATRYAPLYPPACNALERPRQPKLAAHVLWLQPHRNRHRDRIRYPR